MTPPSPVRKLCWWAVPCAAAIFLAVYLMPESWLLPAGAFCALAGMSALFFHGKVRKKVALTAAGLAVGLLWTGLYSLLFRAPAHALADREPQVYSFVVVDFPSETRRGAALPVRLSLEGAPDPLVQLYGEADALELLPGDTVTAVLRLAPSDFLRGETIDYYQSKGIYLLGYVQEALSLETRPDRPSPRFWPQYAARALKQSVARCLPADVSGFVTALLTGDKSTLPTGLYAAFQRSGLSHVVAVSGLHISFLAGLLTVLLGRMNGVSATSTLLLIFFFAALAGNSPSALRASFMAAFPLLAPLCLREDDKPTTLSAVLVLLLLQCPYAAASVSLQLSFAAVAGIYLITGPLYTRWLRSIPKWDKLPGSLLRKILIFAAGTMATTLGALLFTTPLAAIHFHSVSLAGPLTNLLTLWAVSDTFLGGLLSALLNLIFPPLGIALAWLTAWPARWVIWIATTISRLPFAALSLHTPYLLGWFVMAYTIILLTLASRRRVRPTVLVAAILPSLCVTLVMNTWPTINSALTVAVLDVGQGASTLLCSKGRAVLVDCGGNGGDNPGDVAADYLQTLGTSRLDALILTHCHADHAGGVPELLSRVEVSLLILPEASADEPLCQEILSLAEQYGCEVQLLTSDAAAIFGDASLKLFAPLGDGGSNEEGLSLLCTSGDFDALITGDMNDVIERRLVKYKSLPDIELLVVGHHGSKSSTSEELLLATTPETAAISCGYNTYGHPASETLERLGAAGCGIYRTDLMGTVVFTIPGK